MAREVTAAPPADEDVEYDPRTHLDEFLEALPEEVLHHEGVMKGEDHGGDAADAEEGAEGGADEEPDGSYWSNKFMYT